MMLFGIPIDQDCVDEKAGRESFLELVVKSLHFFQREIHGNRDTSPRPGAPSRQEITGLFLLLSPDVTTSRRLTLIPLCCH